MYDKYRVDELYDFLFVRSIVNLSNWFWRTADDGFIDWMANGLARVASEAGSAVRTFQTGLVQNYALSIAVGVVFVLGYLLFS